MIDCFIELAKMGMFQSDDVMSKLIIVLISVCFLLPIPVESETVPKKKFQDEIRYYIKHDEHQIIREFMELLSIPNVSADRKNVRKNTEWLTQMMEKRGIRARVMETGGNLVVYGEVVVPGATWTLGFYAHYDGLPVDPSKWTDSKPFEPVFSSGKQEVGTDFLKSNSSILLPEKFDDDWRIYARSASDDKAAIIALLSAVSAIKSAGFPLENNINPYSPY